MRARKGHARRKARKRLLGEVKGNFGARGKLVKMASETLLRARAFAFRDRRAKKRSFRALWIVRVTAACRARGIPILRRCSGGGAVVQAPGCLNFALVLCLASRPGLDSVARANLSIMTMHRDALAHLVPAPVRIQGITDLTIQGRKVSGNAQRRGRSHLLFHGTFLLACDLSLMEALLPLPSRAPDYRRSRRHLEFVANLGLAADVLQEALRTGWGAREPMEPVPADAIDRLVRNRYGRADWTDKL